VVEEEWIESRYLFAGFKCQNIGSTILPNYEVWQYQSFVKFDTLNLDPAKVTSVTLYLWQVGGKYVASNVALNISVDVYARSSYSSSAFPWDGMDANDWGTTGWSKVGSLCYVKQAVMNSPSSWFSIDVTDEYKLALSSSWQYFGISLLSSPLKPSGWSNTKAYTPNEEAYVSLGSALSLNTASYVPSSYEEEAGYSSRLQCPTLRIEYTESVPAPTASPVNCVTADAKAKVALAGTDSGNLWKIFEKYDKWYKYILYEFEDSVTAIYIDSKKNFLDEPNDAIVWVGLDNGKVYRSEKAGKSPWSLMKTCDDSIDEIRGSELDSNKVAVGEGYNIHTTSNYGKTWRTSTRPTQFRGLFVRGDNVQVLFDNGRGFYSSDFGINWDSMAGEPDGEDVCFNKLDPTKSFIVTNGAVYISDADFNYTEGASVDGVSTVSTASLYRQIAYIGTTEKLYVTKDWGNTVRALKNDSITDVSVGGSELYQ
jgi:hypothetical protein